jgi:hypothetical protein
MSCILEKKNYMYLNAYKKIMHLEKPKRSTIWNGASRCQLYHDSEASDITLEVIWSVIKLCWILCLFDENYFDMLLLFIASEKYYLCNLNSAN